MDIFEILGPVMVGPSSSHTAGALRIARMARSLLAAAPVAIAGFFHYNGMSLEQFLWAFIKSEILCAGPRRFDSVNLHEEVFASIMEDTLE